MSNTYSGNNLTKIILNTNENKLRLWGNTIPIIQPYKIKFRVIGDYDTLSIEFDALEHLEYANSLQKEIYNSIDQMINPEKEKDLKVEQYNNEETNKPGVIFSISAKKYEFKVAESWNLPEY